jgi:hypothetical protein
MYPTRRIYSREYGGVPRVFLAFERGVVNFFSAVRVNCCELGEVRPFSKQPPIAWIATDRQAI